jgi:hypothetical protein
MATSKQVQDTQRRKKLKAIEMFGGKCQICGYNKCPNALEFHHVGEKKESPSYIIMRWSWERAKKELEKCILICANCHREIHYQNRNVGFSRFLKPWLTIRCQQCKSSFETKNEDQIFCSDICRHVGVRKVKQRPNKEELASLIKEFPWVRIGKMFKVSDNAVRKWARKYELLK